MTRKLLVFAVWIAIRSSNPCVGQSPLLFEDPVELPRPVNIRGGFSWDSSATLSPDELTMYFWSNRSGWYTYVAERSSLNEDFENVKKANFGLKAAGNPDMSNDGLTLVVQGCSDGACLTNDIYMATRTEVGQDFGAFQRLGDGVNSALNEHFPSISPDGLELYFTRTEGDLLDADQTDIMFATRPDKSSPFGTAQLLPSPLNQPDSNEGFTTLSPDGLAMVFHSDREGGFGGFDLWVSTREDTLTSSWSVPKNLGSTINSEDDEGSPNLTADGQTLYFTRSPVDSWDGQIWSAEIIHKPFDFTRDGTLDVADLDHLQTQVRAGATDTAFDVNGDGIVDSIDVQEFVTRADILNSWIGDSNLDGEFNSMDLVSVFEAGEYEDAAIGNSTWSTGDWSGDGEFDTSDLVVAFQDGGYEQGPRGGVAAVPEPSAFAIVMGGMMALATGRRWRLRPNL